MWLFALADMILKKIYVNLEKEINKDKNQQAVCRSVALLFLISFKSKVLWQA